MIRILFCNISYLPYYNTRLDRVAPKNGGAYVAKMHDAYEKHNFEECADGQYRGFVETKYRIGYEEGIATNTYNSLHIERIDLCALHGGERTKPDRRPAGKGKGAEPHRIQAAGGQKNTASDSGERVSLARKHRCLHP